MGAASINNTPKDENKSHETKDIISFAEIWNKTEKKFDHTELLKDYVDQIVVINGCETGEGVYGPFVILSVSINGDDKHLRTSGKAIIDQAFKIKDKIPVNAKIIQKMGKNGRRYLSLS